MLTTIVAITLFALFCLIHLCLYLGSLSISQWLVGSPCAHLDTKVIKKKKSIFHKSYHRKNNAGNRQRAVSYSELYEDCEGEM